MSVMPLLSPSFRAQIIAGTIATDFVRISPDASLGPDELLAEHGQGNQEHGGEEPKDAGAEPHGDDCGAVAAGVSGRCPAETDGVAVSPAERLAVKHPARR